MSHQTLHWVRRAETTDLSFGTAAVGAVPTVPKFDGERGEYRSAPWSPEGVQGAEAVPPSGNPSASSLQDGSRPRTGSMEEYDEDPAGIGELPWVHSDMVQLFEVRSQADGCECLRLGREAKKAYFIPVRNG